MEAVLGILLVGGFVWVVKAGTEAAKTPPVKPLPTGFKELAAANSSTDYLNLTRKKGDAGPDIYAKISVVTPSSKSWWRANKADAPASERQLN